MADNDITPVTVYGCNISYFTGKLENYFRVKGIDYELRAMRLPDEEKMYREKVGLWQMPIIELADGRWMTDTTKIIEWFEQRYTDKPILPPDPLQAFVCLLLEDYADEWLWRPAMHYRWYYDEGAHFASRHLAEEILSMPLPGFVRRWMLRRRQRAGYTMGDGIRHDSVPGVEAIYLRTLEQLERILREQAFILGDRPSLADIGFSGPFFRHFGLDPVPLEIMRQRAPAVWAWITRLWNTGPDDVIAPWPDTLSPSIGPILDEVGESYLPYLNANARAVAAGKKRFDADVGGVSYRGAHYSRYRVWCLQQLRDHYAAVPEACQAEVRALLERHGAWGPLWEIEQLPLLPGQEAELPFRGATKMVGTNE